MNMIEYFHGIALDVAKRSKCLSRNIGAVIARGDTIISTGYNGPPRGTMHCDRRHLYDQGLRNEFIEAHVNVPDNHIENCPRYLIGASSGERLDLCPAVHAEVNAILNAGRNGVSCVGATMYLTCEIPCKNCLAAIINAGIKSVWVEHISRYDILTEFFLSNAALNVREYPKPLS